MRSTNLLLLLLLLLTLTVTLKITKKENDTGMKLNIELYLKVDFLGTGRVYNRPITGNGTRTHMDGPDF